MNDRPGAVPIDHHHQRQEQPTKGMHDIGRNLIMGGSSGQTAIVTTTTSTTNGIATVLEPATNSNGHSLPPTNSSASSASAGASYMNNNNCVKRQQVIKCSPSAVLPTNSEPVPVEGLELKPNVSNVTTMSSSGGGGAGGQLVNSNSKNARGTESESVIVSSSSSRSSSLSISPQPMMLMRDTQEAARDEEAAAEEDPRKVEPLKINLHREPIRTVIKLSNSGGQSVDGNSMISPPKITIKPIPNPAVPVVSSTNEAVEENAIPKLHIRMNHNTEASSAASANVATIPKLTIRNQQAENTVPKLMIKMGGQHTGQPRVHSPVPKVTIKTNSLGERATVGDSPATNEHLTVPKLTIKVDQTTSNNNTNSGTVSPGSALISSSHNNSTIKNHLANDVIPKLMMKQNAEDTSFQIVNSTEAQVPRLKVKLSRTPCPPVAPSEDDSEVSDTSSDVVDEGKPTARIPKLTIKSMASPTKFHGTNESEAGLAGDHHPEVPKLVIKSIPKPEGIGVDETEALPLDIGTSVGGGGAGPQSPRIILKINKNQKSIVSNDGQENILKRHLQQEHVNNTPKRSKAEERIIAVIDLDEEESRSSDGAVVERNGRSSRRKLQAEVNQRRLEEEAEEVDSSSGEEEKEKLNSGTEEKKVNCTQNVPENNRVRDKAGVAAVEKPEEGEDVVEERLQGAHDNEPGMQTPVVKRGRGRPRKTPIVTREVDGSSNSNSNAATPGTTKKRMRKKKEDPSSQLPVTDSAQASEDESLPSPAAFNTTARKPRGGGRGGMRTPSTRGTGSKRGRGSARKPFNKQQYFKQKTFEESIMSSYFEEDTRMSAADSSAAATPKVSAVSSQSNDPQDSVSQSSHLSSTSVTMDSTQTSSLPTRKKLKMEVVGTMEGKAEFTVDMLAEYVWPQGVGCCPNKNRDTFMIQEQIAEYLGVKSFKRKYPDLERRTVEMEERDHLIERGLATEKLCDLGVTAVYAVDVLDIMHQDFHDKYEEYKQYHREKLAKDLSLRAKMQKCEMGLGAREKAMRSVSQWNTSLNKTRGEERRVHMDLQNFTIHVPEAKRKQMTYPSEKPSLYPVALVVGQFLEYYRTYSPLELQCYPINTATANPDDLMKRLLEEKMHKRSQEEAKAAAAAASASAVEAQNPEKALSESSESSDESVDSDEAESVDTSSSESDCDVHDDDVCCVCAKSQFTSPHTIPELFVKCAICMKMAHPSCIEMSSEMAKRAFQYQWQCVDCKRCHGCQKPNDQQKMIYCQQCDRAYHIYCTKSLQGIPKGLWHCDICSICRKCGCRNPDGTNSKMHKHMVSSGHQPSSHRRPEWKHEFVKNEATGLKEHLGMLCVRCVSSSS